MPSKLVKQQRRLSDSDLHILDEETNSSKLQLPKDAHQKSRSYQNLNISYNNSFNNSFDSSNSGSTDQLHHVPQHNVSINLRPVRIAVLGDTCVGKSALTVRFITKRFITEYSPTLESTYQYQDTVDNQLATFHILDTAGIDVLKETNMMWADGFICMYSVTDPTSFEVMKETVNTIAKTKSLKCPCIIVGNKTDLKHFRDVTLFEGKTFARSYQHLFAEVSVSEDIADVRDVFCNIYRRIVQVNYTKKKANVQMKMIMSKMFPRKRDYQKRKDRNKTVVL